MALNLEPLWLMFPALETDLARAALEASTVRDDLEDRAVNLPALRRLRTSLEGAAALVAAISDAVDPQAGQALPILRLPSRDYGAVALPLLSSLDAPPLES